MKKKMNKIVKRITIAMLLICILLQSEKTTLADTQMQSSATQSSITQQSANAGNSNDVGNTNDAGNTDNVGNTNGVGNTNNVSNTANLGNAKDAFNQSSPIIPLTQQNIKDFTDQYFQTNMEKWNVPGAAVSVVENGKELYQSGYGVSDIESQTPVDPATTTFPAASVSKLFTATAIMQLSQSGKLDLNENIQTYLDEITIKNPFSEAVTCQNLLTHSSGLDEESELDGSTLDRTAIKSPKQYLEAHVPTVILQPNTVCRYSNMGYNLLGYVVEKVSGESYEDYVTNHILMPLHMEHASIRIEKDSMTDNVLESGSITTSSMATGYEYSDGQYEKMPFAYQYTSGSSGVIATVSDMENFMKMHLNNGMYECQSIIDADTEAQMQKKQFANNDVFEGMGEGFIRDCWNGVQIVKHEGALPGYTTTMLLIPGQNFGIYVATNSLGGMVFDFEEAFLEHFFGSLHTLNDASNSNNSNNLNNSNNASNSSNTDTASNTTNQTDPSTNLNKYIGTYRSYDGISMSNISKILATIDITAEFKVEKSENGNLTVIYYEESKEKVKTNLIYQADGIFAREDGKGYITFRENNSGNVIYAFNKISHQTYMKTGIFETSNFIYMELLVLMLLLLGSAVLIIIKSIRHKQKNNKKFWLLNCLINLGYVFGFTGVFLLECYMILNYDYRFMGMIYLLLTILLAAMVSNIVEIFVFGYGIIKKKFDKRTIVKFVILQIAQILFVIMLGYFNMIGYHVF